MRGVSAGWGYGFNEVEWGRKKSGERGLLNLQGYKSNSRPSNHEFVNRIIRDYWAVMLHENSMPQGLYLFISFFEDKKSKGQIKNWSSRKSH